MKRIVAVSVVRNESDIIESFCRYLCSYCDRLLIHDDHSIDSTREILAALVTEGLPISFSDEFIDLEYDEYRLPQTRISNRLIQLAFETFGADLAFVADADEFVMTVDGRSPRDILEQFDAATEYRALWRTYVCDAKLTQNNKFLPDYFSTYRNPVLERFGKVFISRTLVEDYQCRLTDGNHSLAYADPQKMPSVQYLDDVSIAHYPIRSVDQLARKVVNGWFSYLASPNHAEGRGYHWEKIYRHIKMLGVFDEQVAMDESLRYALQDGIVLEGNLPQTLTGPLRTEFLIEPIRLIYTEYNRMEKNSFGCILENTEQLIQFLVQKQKQAKCLAEEAETENNQLKNTLSWRITKPLRSVGFFLRKKT
ncbi:MAG: glycosyltransferase family 2 protein [Clostridiaceae bacterium]